MHLRSKLVELPRVAKDTVLSFVTAPVQGLVALGGVQAVLRGAKYSNTWRPASAANADAHRLDSPATPACSNPLQSWFDAHQEGRTVFKWRHYFDIYHRHFQRFIGREVHILEIGVFGGGSLEMWRQYFGPNCHVYGIDILDSCKAYETEGVSVFIGNQSDRKFWRTLMSKVPAIDILVDDGSHLGKDQIVTFEETLPYLSPGGIYLCEDLGPNNEFVSYLHGLINGLNGAATEFKRRIGSVSFYPHVAVIEKRMEPVERFVAEMKGSEAVDAVP